MTKIDKKYIKKANELAKKMNVGDNDIILEKDERIFKYTITFKKINNNQFSLSLVRLGKNSGNEYECDYKIINIR